LIKNDWKRLSAELAYSEVLRGFNEPFEPRPMTSWMGLENFDFIDIFKFSIFKRYTVLQAEAKE
jgi:hypothetical protein